MKHFIALIATGFVVTLAASPASAQRFSSHPFDTGQAAGGLVRSPFAHDPFAHDQGRDHGGPQVDLIGLRNLVGELGLVCQHLHDDVRQLSQDYQHSAAIAGYIDRLERLKGHMFEVLQQATACGRYSPSTERHIRQDTSEAKALLIGFYRQLENQTFDGVRDCDFRLITHMKDIMLNEAFPLMTRLEIAVFGGDQGGFHHGDFHRGVFGQASSSHRATRPSFGFSERPSLGYSEQRIETQRSSIPRVSVRAPVAVPATPPLPPFAERILRRATFGGPPTPFGGSPFGGPSPFSGFRITF